MKKCLFIFSILTYTLLDLAPQTPIKLAAGCYDYGAGDSLYKYQVTYKYPGSIGRALEWDFSHLQTVNENYHIRYFHPDPEDTSKVCGLEHDTRYYYRQLGDSLWSTGFENYTTLMEYIKPELKMKFPFDYGDTLFSAFEGKGMYCNMFPLHVKGYTRTKADAYGTLILPDSEQRQALRVHTSRYYTETGKDSVDMQLDTYSWYVKDIRYPVFESIKTTLHKPHGTSPKETGIDTTVFYTSFYYFPEALQHKSTDNATDIYGYSVSEADKVFTETSMLPNPVLNDLNIRFKLTRKATIWFSVHNNIGQPMCQTAHQTLNAGGHYQTIPMSSLYKGTYTIYVHVDNMAIQRVVVKK